MKKLIIAFLLLTTINAFADAEYIEFDHLRELNQAQISNVYDALLFANDGNEMYGTCSLVWIKHNQSIRVFVNDATVDPLLLILSNNEWQKITTNAAMTKIVSIAVGQHSLIRINLGTIINPVFQTARKVTSSSNCIE